MRSTKRFLLVVFMGCIFINLTACSFSFNDDDIKTGITIKENEESSKD
ncbi:hypothetical protein [Alkalihalobacillus pseudalcaliphilus]|nr:hypothetical protein [Alkalihalobacillus pseudalcaliphilus]